MRKLLLLLLFVGSAYGQGQTINFPAPIYWDANTEPDVLDYGVYRSTTPCTDPNPSPVTCLNFSQQAAVVQGPDPRQWTEPGPITFVQDYYYRITARNTSGNESLFSNELNLRWLNPNAPGAPGDLRSLEQGANMRLDWDDNEHVAVWKVYKSMDEAKQGALLAHTSVSEYKDTNPGRVGPRWYNITAVNDDGDESPATGPVIYVGK